MKDGMTQKEIAEKTDTKQQMISRFLQGQAPSVETLKKIAVAFGVTTDHVLGLEKRNSNDSKRPKSLGANSRREIF
jgi:transcriptional regulator with XRE-family HTH domain